MKIVFQSLMVRLVLASALLLPIVLGGTGWYLERSHRAALNAATVERLQLQVLALLAQADVTRDFTLPLLPLERRLATPNSGLYGIVTGPGNELLWLSPSAELLESPGETLTRGVPPLQMGESHDSEENGLFRHAYQVLWELAPGEEMAMRFIVAETTGPRDADVQTFRRQLWLWLSVTVLLLLAVQLLIARWGLAPLSRLSRSIARVEAGEAAELSGDWPREVRPVVDNLQTLIDGEQRRRERLRNTLADLAHTLKTPLAVLKSADPTEADFPVVQREQLDRMEEVIGWQLQRASHGQGPSLQRTSLAPVLARLRETLNKVYAERQLNIDIQCPDSARFRGDERDLMEFMGNLMDNACKYGRSQVRVRGVTAHAGPGLTIEVEDDGEGISPEIRDALLRRGARADTRREGQGIGLALVRETVESQGGALAFSESELGGARVTVTLP